MIIKTWTPLAATETINFLWKYSTNFIITLYCSVLLHKSDFMLIRCLSKHLLAAGYGIKYDTLRSKTCKSKCFPRCAVRIFNSKWGVISDQHTTTREEKMDGGFWMLQLTLIKRERCEWKKKYFKDEFVALWWKSCEKSANVNVFLSVLRVPPKLLFLEKRAYIFSLSCIWFYK